MGGVIEFPPIQRPSSKGDRRAKGMDAGGGCAVRRPRAGHQAIDDVLEPIPGAEGYLLEVLGREGQDGSALAHLTAAARELNGIQTASELIIAIPRLAIAVGGGAAAELMRVRADGAVETLSRSGAPFDTAPWLVAELAREALREAASERGGLPRTERPAGRGERLAAVPLAQGPEGLVLVLERGAGEVSAALDERDIEGLAVYAALANAALTGKTAQAALREASARNALTLGAIREGVIAVDRQGVVCALNPVGAAVLGVRCEDLVGRRLSEVPKLAALVVALSGPTGQETEVAALPRGEVVLRPQACEGGVVAILCHRATEQAIARRRAGSVPRYTFEHLIGASPELRSVLDEAKRAAICDVPVLVGGESGTGKEMLAQAIHNASPRAAEPFLGINVTAIPRELLESELFGYEGGSFTGARTTGRAGKFELAGGGTLLLDEIGDMPLEMQGKLLRVLQERIVQRIGSARDIPVRARIIATTSRDLGLAVEQGRFRLDLYHRLRVLQLRLPPLRERKGDVPLLVEDQLRCHAERSQRRVGMAPQVLAALEAHDWPGNVRELRNIIEGELSVLSPGDGLLTRVPPFLRQPRRPLRPATPQTSEILPLAEVEHQACQRALLACEGNVARAARALGVAKGTLYAKMKLYGIGQRAVSPSASGQADGSRPAEP